MRKTALAVAVGGLFIAPAAQAQIVFGNETLGTLQLYGKLYPQFGYGSSKDQSTVGTSVSTLVSGTGVCGSSTSGAFTTNTGGCASTTPGPRRAVDVQNSYLGFRGERGLGTALGGLKAIWQIETALNFDDPAASGSTTGRWSTRNSFAGLSSRGFGTVKLGNMDTIYKEYGDTLQMLGISSGNFVSASNVLSQIGVGRSTTARFHERKANSIQYETPQFAGFTAGYQYSPDESRVTSGGGTDASLHSYGVKWDSRMFYVSVHQEQHNDFFGGSNNVGTTALSNIGTLGAHSRDTGTRLSLQVRPIAGHRFTFDVSRLKYRESGQAAGVKFESYQHTTWALGWEGAFGAWHPSAQYVRGNEGNCSLTGGAACSTTGLTGYMFNVGLRYDFDRQTGVYAIAGKLVNGASTRYDNWSAADPARGADIVQAALGLLYRF